MFVDFFPLRCDLQVFSTVPHTCLMHQSLFRAEHVIPFVFYQPSASSPLLFVSISSLNSTLSCFPPPFSSHNILRHISPTRSSAFLSLSRSHVVVCFHFHIVFSSLRGFSFYLYYHLPFLCLLYFPSQNFACTCSTTFTHWKRQETRFILELSEQPRPRNQSARLGST